MDAIIKPIESALTNYGPQVLSAIIILVVGWIIAIIAKNILGGAIDKIPFVKNANGNAKGNDKIGQSLGVAAYWVVILGALVLALEKLGMTSIASSIRSTLDQIFAYLPQLIGAALTFFVFFIVAKVARQAVVATLNAVQANEAPQRFGLTDKSVNLSNPLGAIVFALLIIPGSIAALQVLDISAITDPAVAMLNDVMTSIPNIIVSIFIIGIFALIANFVRDLISNTLPNTGIDNTVAKMGLMDGADGMRVSKLVASIAGFLILLLGLIQGMKTLGFEPLTQALDTVLAMASQIIFGSVIIFAGVLISGFVAKAIAAAGTGMGDFAAKAVRGIIITLASILGISRMGLDPSGVFVTNAAQIILIGTALAGGIAFGLGGKEWAARQLDKLGK